MIFSELYSKDYKIKNAICLPERSFISYLNKNIKIKDVDIFGYRHNSDGFANCNTQEALIERCFARTGDDLFSVKALGAPDTAPSENITFTNCVGWGGKARCYGITGEVNKPIRNITYNAAMKNKISAANETNTMNETVENVNFLKLNSSKPAN